MSEECDTDCASLMRNGVITVTFEIHQILANSFIEIDQNMANSFIEIDQNMANSFIKTISSRFMEFFFIF